MMLKWICMLVLLMAGNAHGAVRLPGFFTDHMVLQRGVPVTIWGWADPGEKVTVSVAGKHATATAGADGRWRTQIAASPAGGPYELQAKAGNSITLKDVMIGEVWLCSGQSNMEWTVQQSGNARAEIKAANHPMIRHVKIPKRSWGYPIDDVSAKWEVCSPDTVARFTATGYYMGRKLQKELGVAVGLINASWGGTRIEPWVPPVGFESVPALADIQAKIAERSPNNPAYQEAVAAYVETVEKWLPQAKGAKTHHMPLSPLPKMPSILTGPKSHQEPLMLYNGMVHALVGYTIKGAIWYQGESNHTEGALYTEKKKALIGGWRKLWGIGDFPFYFVQIAPFKNYKSNVLPNFWEAQEKVLAVVPNTGMVVTNDIATIHDIHPPNKQDVGNRLALLALKNDYDKNVVASGPTFQRLEIKGKTLRVVFANATGLKSRNGKPLTHFEIAGKGTGYHKATARIDGNAVVLSATEVPEPLAMRYAWHKTAEPNLCNSAGLPSGAFRAGEIPRADFLPQIADAKGYRLVYDLDLDKACASVAYDVDESAKAGAFTRVAYLLELGANREEQYVYVSMDAFTKEAAKLGVPTVASKALFQQEVQSLTVASNVKGIATGSGITGNIEFWPSNYLPGNSAKVPGASAKIYDFGDHHTGAAAGYGSMQVHNPGAKQTLFAINNWRASLETGIGNSEGKTRDWTFAANGGSYEYKRLRVLVK